MANQSYLYMSDSSEPFTDGIPEHQIVAAGRYVMPIFWFTAFVVADIYDAVYDMVNEDTDEEEGVPVAVLRTTKDLAIQRAIGRRDSCFRILPDSLQPIYDQWLALLEGLELPHLHLETSELWMMGPDEPYDDFLGTCVRAMEEFREEDWDVLFSHTSINFDPQTRRVSASEKYGEDIVPYLLHGHSWIRPVPWDE